MTYTFEVYKAKDGWRWRLVAGNNKTVAQGESYTRRSSAMRAVRKMADAVVVIKKTS